MNTAEPLIEGAKRIAEELVQDNSGSPSSVSRLVRDGETFLDKRLFDVSYAHFRAAREIAPMPVASPVVQARYAELPLASLGMMIAEYEMASDISEDARSIRVRSIGDLARSAALRDYGPRVKDMLDGAGLEYVLGPDR